MIASIYINDVINHWGYEQAFRMAKAAGFDAVDFTVDSYAGTVEAVKASTVFGKSEEEILSTFSAIRESARKAGIVIGQTHSMFGSAEIQSLPEYKEVIDNSITATAALGCRYIVVHPLHRRIEEGPVGIDASEAFYRSFIPQCRKYNVKIAIENMFEMSNGEIHPGDCSTPAEMLELMKRLGSECFCTCADAGHFALVQDDTGIKPADAIRALGSTLEVLHLQEVDLKNDYHTTPFTFTNVMDWDDIAKALNDIGYRGTFNLEVSNMMRHPAVLQNDALCYIGSVARYLISKAGI